jgi:hypothetical protein
MCFSLSCSKYLLHGNCEEDILRPEEDSGNYSDPVVWILIGCIVIVFILLLILVIVCEYKWYFRDSLSLALNYRRIYTDPMNISYSLNQQVSMPIVAIDTASELKS